MTTVRELSLAEQVRMNIDKAGELYKGYFIFFTNSEEKWENDVWEEYGIPRIIAECAADFYDSGLSEKYKGSAEYGTRFYCSAFVAEENIPPVLAF